MKEIKLTQGKVTMVDDEDYEFLNKWKWHYNNGYAAKAARTSDGKRKSLRMHRLILLPHYGEMTDHINRDRLDNRRKNLRICTLRTNSYNRGKPKNNKSGYKGVYERSGRLKKWEARIQVNDTPVHIGNFYTAAEAARAYNEKALELHGDFACINIME
jgi:hypothetical protein